ncbi:MAG: DUF3558 family protein [Catenulispora sp.]|nr:DUF3558 family protein [Catenulispora sp.]
MPVPRRDVPDRAVPRSADRSARLALAGAAAALVLAACSNGSSTPPSSAAAASDPSPATASTSESGGPQGLAVPGVPDPCALLSADQVIQATHIPDNSKNGPVASSSGGRSCAFNSGHPSAVTISLTAVTKAGFDAFRATIPANTVTDVPGLGQEAYRSSQTPGVIDVFKNGFDLNVAVLHADSDASASADAKALAALLVAKL